MSVTSSKACQASQADFLPIRLKADTVSQPVMAWNTGRAFDLDLDQMSLML